jgi:hypothetical protein
VSSTPHSCQVSPHLSEIARSYPPWLIFLFRCIVLIRRSLGFQVCLKGQDMHAKCSVWALVLIALSSGHASALPSDDAWEPYRFLVGEWTGDGSGEPGKGSGRFSFAWDLQEKILVRRNRAEYAAANGRAASSHEDLMVMYRPDQSGRCNAIYFDSEGHVINYAVTISDDKRTLTFLSDNVPTAPRFRLSYTKGADDSMVIKFEIAPPGKSEGFKNYLVGAARRQTEPKSVKSKS